MPVKQKSGLVQVKEAFAGTFEGTPLVLNVGQVFQDDDPYVRQWPQFFEPLDAKPFRDSRPPVEQATAAPGEKRGG